jgi:hypothetical protein
MRITVRARPIVTGRFPLLEGARRTPSKRRRHELIGSRAERKLAVAVFCQAADDLQKFRYERHETEHAIYADARNWLASNDRSWPYSFLNICDALQLTPGLVRAKLLANSSHRSSLTPCLSASTVASAFRN